MENVILPVVHSEGIQMRILTPISRGKTLLLVRPSLKSKAQKRPLILKIVLIKLPDFFDDKILAELRKHLPPSKGFQRPGQITIHNIDPMVHDSVTASEETRPPCYAGMVSYGLGTLNISTGNPPTPSHPTYYPCTN